MILAADASADTDDHWPDGSELYHTYQRLTDPKNTLATPVSMPSIPPPETFIKLGLNKKITFFGCGDMNKDPHTPVIVYIPNHQKNFATNFSTFDDKYSKGDIQRIFDNGLAIATNDGDLGFRTCMSCAVILNSLIRSELTPPTVCAECFEKHCWSLPS
jgi:lysophospholipase